jgi:prephenate dehydrogenase
MGSFLVRYFLSEGFNVSGADPRPKYFGSRRFTFHRSNWIAVKGTDVAVVASPVGTTADVVKEILGNMKAGSVVFEISSVKGPVLPHLRRAFRGSKVRLVSIHPLFGPSAPSLKGMKIAVVRVDNRNQELKLAKRTFPQADLVPMTQEGHDELMALTLSLTHLIGILYSKTLSRYVSPRSFRKASTPTASILLTLAESVLSQDPSLCSYIQVENKFSIAVLRSLARDLQDLVSLIERADRSEFEKVLRRLKRVYVNDVVLNKGTKKLYEVSALDGTLRPKR